MTSIDSFKDSLKNNTPNPSYSPMLTSLWYDAYLHRKEGDLWNADYWYAKAGRSRPDIPLRTEWENLVKFFLAKPNPGH